MSQNKLFHYICACTLALNVVTFVVSPFVFASTYVAVGADVYDILGRLEAEGVIKSALLTTRPMSRKEVVRLILEAEKNSDGRGPVILSQIQYLKNKFKNDLDRIKYVKPLDEIKTAYIHAGKAPSELSFNNDGDEYEDGSNVRLRASSRAELGWLSVFMEPEIRYSDGHTDVTLNKAYGVLDVWGCELELGKDVQWWGPGYHGAILLSNNPVPFTMIKFTNSAPIMLPWLFKYLGLFKFTGFLTQLEHDRVVPEPYLWGMRFNLKPCPYVEIGMERTAMLGGKGRPSGLRTWWNSFTGFGENSTSGSGDQRAGFDFKFTLPFDVQPFQVYLEADGEDEAGGLPSNYALLYGLYLPRILDFERVEFRAEYANDHVDGKPNVWYTHGVYQSGYTYKNRIIGHHMGTDSEDLFIELSYFFPEVNGKVSLAYDKKEHNMSEKTREKKDEVYITGRMDICESLRLRAAYGYGKIKNLDNLPRNNENISTFIFQMDYLF